MNDDRKFSRRAVIRIVALASVAPLVAAAVDEAQAAKASKATMQYRDTPNGKQDCSNCLQFIPGKTAKANGQCKVVAGSISPHGWCIAYAPKA
jgi:High potential iron-sulfur protein